MRTRTILAAIATASVAAGIACATLVPNGPTIVPAVTPAQYGVAVPTYAGDAAVLPPCEFEDGPGPCRWHADEAGNGVGHSFWIDADACTHYFDKTDDAKWGDHSSPCEDPYAGEH